MRLGALLGTDASADVSGFAIDHRKVAPGTVFGAFKGARFNGEDFIADAVKAGAVAVVSAHGAKVCGTVHITSDQPRRDFAMLAAKFFAPFPRTTVAVTGTNGKTSTVELTRQLWRMAGHHAASIGTLGVTTADERVVTGLTTPDIVTFLSNMQGWRAKASHMPRSRHRATGSTNIAPKDCLSRRELSLISAAITSTIMAIWQLILQRN